MSSEKKEQRKVTFDQAAQNLVNFRSNLLALASRPLQRLAAFQEEWQAARARAESAQVDHHNSPQPQITAAEIIEELLKLPAEELAKFGLQKLQEQELQEEQEEPPSEKFRTPSSVAGGSGVSPVLNRTYLQEREASRTTIRRPKASMIA